jgi:hypothetical protein
MCAGIPLAAGTEGPPTIRCDKMMLLPGVIKEFRYITLT